MNKAISIYTEANPNPNSLKFVTNVFLTEEGTDYDFDSPENAKSSPLAGALFQLPFLKRVFIMNNFITLTKVDEVDWEDVRKELSDFIREYLVAGHPIIVANKDADTQPARTKEVYAAEDVEVVEKIKTLLEEYVRPAVESDGGAINFAAYDKGVVTVELRGSCSGCPSSTLTLKQGIENLLKRFVPEVKSVESLSV